MEERKGKEWKTRHRGGDGGKEEKEGIGKGRKENGGSK